MPSGTSIWRISGIFSARAAKCSRGRLFRRDASLPGAGARAFRARRACSTVPSGRQPV